MTDHSTTIPDATVPVPVVAVHGNGGGASRFALVADALARRADAPVSLHPLTLPGFSTVPREASLRTVGDYADRVGDHVAAVTAACGRAPVLLGHGIGGTFALDLASRQPHLLAGLILHAPVGAHLDTRLFPRVMSTAPVRALAKRLIAARPPRPLWRRLFFPHGAPRAVLDRFFDEYRVCESFGQMFEIITPEWFDGLAPVTEVPTVLLWGARDRVLRSGQADTIRAKTPGAEMVVHPGWDHFPMIEQPEEYADELVALTRRLVGPA